MVHSVLGELETGGGLEIGRLGERGIIFTRFSKITLKETVEPAPEVKINIRNEWNSYHFY